MKKELRAFGFDDPLKTELEQLITIHADLRRAISCLQTLVPPSQLMRDSGIIGMALHTQALVSYARCFTSGRRKGLGVAVYSAKPEYLAIHNDIKSLRDKHVAHSVGKSEHCNVLVAAKDETSPAEGLGVRYWFLAGGDGKYMKNFLKIAEFSQRHTATEIERVGNLLSKKYLGSKATWKKAQRAFYQSVSEEAVYGPIKRET